MDSTVVDRFNKYISKIPGGCWLWTGAKNSDGYGHIGINGKTIKAHRLSWMIYFGDIPDNTEVCHSCDNRSCVNPLHIFLGTHQDNMEDMKNKGRAKRNNGSSNGRAKLSDNLVVEIRERWDNSKTRYGLLKSLSYEYQIPYGTMAKIVNRTTWNLIS